MEVPAGVSTADGALGLEVCESHVPDAYDTFFVYSDEFSFEVAVDGL